MPDIFRKSVAAIGFCAVASLGTTTHADSVSDFYKGKSIRFHIGAAPGGGYDLYSRTLAQHMEAKIPGKPKILIVSATQEKAACPHFYMICH